MNTIKMGSYNPQFNRFENNDNYTKVKSYVQKLPKLRIPNKVSARLHEVNRKVILVALKALRILVSILKMSCPFGQKKLLDLETRVVKAQIRLGTKRISKPAKKIFRGVSSKCSSFESHKFQKSFEDCISDWVNDPKVTGNKQKAARRILKCYQNAEKNLSLTNLNLSSLPPEIGNLVNLTRLNLFNNELKELPSGIGNLVNLEWLYLSDNKLKKLPPEIGNLVNLTKLCLVRNCLKKLPPEIGNLVNLTELDLWFNKLTELPPEIGNLANLTKLDLSGSKLNNFPPKIGNLVNLTNLYLSGNQLKQLPPEIGNLVNLKTLVLKYNQLQELPTEIGNLVKLGWLHLENNQLQELPVQIGQLYKLDHLDLTRNSLLSQLPLSLGNLPDLTHIGTSGTQILDSDRDVILNSCKKLRKAQAVDALPEKIQVWIKSSKTTIDLSEADQLETEQKGQLYEWLIRLEKTKDFQKSQQELAKIVCTILQEMLQNEEFKELFFTQIEANNECCQDRASMALNEIYTSMLMLRNLQNTTLKDQLELLIGCAKTLALRSAVSQVINDHQEEQGYVEGEGVQIYLYCETHLREELDLETAIKGMTYTVIGKRDWVDEDELVKTVNKTYLEFLLDIPAFEALLKKQKDYQTLESEGTDTIDDEINDLCMKAASTQDKLSNEFLEWETEVNVLNKKRQAKVKKIRKKWVKGQLGL